MRILVTWGSKLGGTEGIARMIGETLEKEGLEVLVLPANEAMKTTRFDAAIIGGALYANRWHAAARRFVNRREDDLREVPVWFFSSGPLDDSAEKAEIPPPSQVQSLMERVGALGHITFGGRLPPDARGFPARAMAKEHAGDWRKPEQIRAWATKIAEALPTARPGVAAPQPGRSPIRLLRHAFLGWLLCAATMGFFLSATGPTFARVVHAITAPILFTLIARHYFRGRGARDPLPTAIAFTATVAALDLVVVAGLIQHSLSMFASFTGTWLPLALIFLATWLTGLLMSTMPWPTDARTPPKKAAPPVHPHASGPKHA